MFDWNLPMDESAGIPGMYERDDLIVAIRNERRIKLCYGK
jgi:hypothetical protein